MAHGPDITPGVPGNVRPGSRRGADGFFQAVQFLNGQWALLEPGGATCFVRAVNGVRNEPSDTQYAEVRDPAVRLRTWGFNAVGIGGDGFGREDGLAFFAAADFCAHYGVIVSPGIRLPDVFAAEWETHTAAVAAATCARLAAAPELIGWIADPHVAWGSAPQLRRPGLLQTCLSLEPSFPAYHAAWEFLLALHGGSLEAVARAWGVSLSNKEMVRELTRAESGITTRGHLRDDSRWAREFARRYFSATTAAIRAADPNHLCFGCPFGSGTLHGIIAAAAYPVTDVHLLPWTELPAPATHRGPILAIDVGWTGERYWGESAAAAPRGRALRLTSLERMLRRARTGLRRMVRHPSVVGYVWPQWHDGPVEHPPFARGLVHVDGREARENTELIADFNARADTLRRSAGNQLSP